MVIFFQEKVLWLRSGHFIDTNFCEIGSKKYCHFYFLRRIYFFPLAFASQYKKKYMKQRQLIPRVRFHYSTPEAATVMRMHTNIAISTVISRPQSVSKPLWFLWFVVFFFAKFETDCWQKLLHFYKIRRNKLFPFN